MWCVNWFKVTCEGTRLTRGIKNKHYIVVEKRKIIQMLHTHQKRLRKNRFFLQIAYTLRATTDSCSLCMCIIPLVVRKNILDAFYLKHGCWDVSYNMLWTEYGSKWALKTCNIPYWSYDIHRRPDQASEKCQNELLRHTCKH